MYGTSRFVMASNSIRCRIEPVKVVQQQNLFNFRYRYYSHHNHNHLKLKGIKSCHYSQMRFRMDIVPHLLVFGAQMFMFSYSFDVNGVEKTDFKLYGLFIAGKP